MALTDKQEMFCREYLVDLNATQAAIRAGYSGKTANAQAGRLLVNVSVQERIQELKSERGERLEVDADYVLKRLVEIDQMDVLDILHDDGGIKPIHEWPKVWRTSLSGMDLAEMFESKDGERDLVGIMKKIKWPDKVKNLEMIGRHRSVGAFVELSKTELTGKNGGPIETATLTKEEYRNARQEMLNEDDC
ncbi:terminase small subunit [Providencia rettgeri]|uniref:terminase small subunit n=1 Tax=Providencia TaxID=586 RepID=UPI001B36E6F2|nr:MULTISPECIES: terminase small subunit [Providencia]EJD6367722.1 terminase small subunit [Providencia rettgeri]EJD6371436.1 terminase small subunit [Providencia rettgeri]ELR5030201.1 terminase small subunit [Providencia rettgeri]ELR5161858.1 terminase small subunit [Providencia rettgeri]ELR5210132.1 terminase small subunit [Providencia rettgeri]